LHPNESIADPGKVGDAPLEGLIDRDAIEKAVELDLCRPIPADFCSTRTDQCRSTPTVQRQTAFVKNGMNVPHPSVG
jgi:hypothetical protein